MMNVKLGEHEVLKAKKRFKELDVDGDGLVSWEDYEAYLIKQKQNKVYTLLLQKQKDVLKRLDSSLKHLRNHDEDAEGHAKKRRNNKTTQKRGTGKKKKELTPEEQAELAELDPFKPGHTEEEKVRIWARIHEIVGDESDDSFSEGVEQLSFSDEKSDEGAASSEEGGVHLKPPKRVASKRTAHNVSSHEEPKSLAGNLRRSITAKKKEKEKDGTLSSSGSNATRDQTTPTESDAETSATSDSEVVTPRKALDNLRKSASSMSKMGRKVVSNVKKKAESGARAAKSKILKEEIQEEPVADPDDPALFAAAYGKKH